MPPTCTHDIQPGRLDAVDVHGHRLTVGAPLMHAHFGVVHVTHLTVGHDGDPRIEVQPIETDTRDWFMFTLSGLRDAWGTTITPAPTEATTTPEDRTRNPVWSGGGRLIDDTHDCIPRIDQTTDDERCKLCGQLLTQ